MPINKDDAFMARRSDARRRLDKFSGSVGGDWADRSCWFEHVYDSAQGDAAQVPWADLAPKPALLDWLAGLPKHERTGRAIDVACGLGDNAEALAAAGFGVTAFDLAVAAISWARKRFPESQVDYQTADLFEMPESWINAFDLVHEAYTIQALDGALRVKAIQSIARLVAPGGRLLVICRARDNDEPADGPPWPLSRNELAAFQDQGLKQVRLDDFVEQRDRPIRHFRIEYRRS